eukprot:g479.t1
MNGSGKPSRLKLSGEKLSRTNQRHQNDVDNVFNTAVTLGGGNKKPSPSGRREKGKFQRHVQNIKLRMAKKKGNGVFGGSRTLSWKKNSPEWANVCNSKVETVRRYRYNMDVIPHTHALSNRNDGNCFIEYGWMKDEIQIKLADTTKPFAQGAMRECYRMIIDGKRYVAKAFRPLMRKSSKQAFKAMKDDVVVQLKCKKIAELFNQAVTSQAKKVDVLDAFIIERLSSNTTGSNSESPKTDHVYFFIEAFVDGEYKKHNDNFGHICDVRNTPQAFSHFSWCITRGKMLVCDIQGVGDLYTDPQVHTCDVTTQNQFHGGNFGVFGMARFFSTHVCNEVCHSLNLPEFSLAKSEKTLVSAWLEEHKRELHTRDLKKKLREEKKKQKESQKRRRRREQEGRSKKVDVSGEKDESLPLGLGNKTTPPQKIVEGSMNIKARRSSSDAATSDPNYYTGGNIEQVSSSLQSATFSTWNAENTQNASQTSSAVEHLERELAKPFLERLATGAKFQRQVSNHVDWDDCLIDVISSDLLTSTKSEMTCHITKEEIDELRKFVPSAASVSACTPDSASSSSSWNSKQLKRFSPLDDDNDEGERENSVVSMSSSSSLLKSPHLKTSKYAEIHYTMALMYLRAPGSLPDYRFRLPNPRLGTYRLKHIIFGFPTRQFAIHHLKQAAIGGKREALEKLEGLYSEIQIDTVQSYAVLGIIATITAFALFKRFKQE